MAMDQSALLDLLAALKDTDASDRVRTATEYLYQKLIDAEATAVIGAGLWQRTVERTVQRTGSRARVLTTTAGDLELLIPKLRTARSSRLCSSVAARSTRRWGHSRRAAVGKSSW